jgi:hypothetical protein
MERAMQFREGSQASAAFVGVGGMCGWNSFLNLSATFSFTRFTAVSFIHLFFHGQANVMGLVLARNYFILFQSLPN